MSTCVKVVPPIGLLRCLTDTLATAAPLVKTVSELGEFRISMPLFADVGVPQFRVVGFGLVMPEPGRIDEAINIVLTCTVHWLTWAACAKAPQRVRAAKAPRAKLKDFIAIAF